MTTPRADAAAFSKPRRESDIQREILRLLGARGIVAWRMNSRVFMVPGRGGKERPMRVGAKGMADILAIVPHRVGDGRVVGQACFIEVKRPGAALSAYQRAFRDVVTRAHGVAFVATSAEDVARELWP